MLRPINDVFVMAGSAARAADILNASYALSGQALVENAQDWVCVPVMMVSCIPAGMIRRVRRHTICRRSGN